MHVLGTGASVRKKRAKSEKTYQGEPDQYVKSSGLQKCSRTRFPVRPWFTEATEASLRMQTRAWAETLLYHTVPYYTIPYTYMSISPLKELLLGCSFRSPQERVDPDLGLLFWPQVARKRSWIQKCSLRPKLHVSYSQDYG